jgi:phage replication O-like protein O
MPDSKGSPPGRDYFKVKNDWFDALIKYRIPGEQMQCVLFIIRRSYGWKLREREISILEFVQATGIKAPNVCRALRELKEKRVITIIKKDNRTHTTYRFNKYFAQWKSIKRKNTAKKLLSKKIIKPQKLLSKKIIPIIKKDNNKPLSPIIVKDSTKDIKTKDTPYTPPPQKALTKTEILEVDAESVIDFMNGQAGKHFKKTNANLAPIRARIKEYSLQECLEVAYKKWHDSDLDNKYYRPITLFRPSLFDGYLNETGTKQKPTRYQTKMRSTVEVFARRHYERQNPTNGN